MSRTARKAGRSQNCCLLPFIFDLRSLIVLCLRGSTTYYSMMWVFPAEQNKASEPAAGGKRSAYATYSIMIVVLYEMENGNPLYMKISRQFLYAVLQRRTRGTISRKSNGFTMMTSAAASSSPPSPTNVTSLNKNDVLLGRGTLPNDYVRNKRFRDHIETRRQEYLSCKYHRCRLP